MRAPHPALRELYRRAACAAQLMERLRDAERAIERLELAFDDRSFSVSEGLASLLMSSPLDDRLAAELDRMTDTDKRAEAGDFKLPGSPPSPVAPPLAEASLKPIAQYAEPRKAPAQQSSVTIPKAIESAQVSVQTKYDSAAKAAPIAGSAPLHPVPPQHTGISPIDAVEAYRHLLESARRAGVGEAAHQPVARAEDTGLTIVKTSVPPASQIDNLSQPFTVEMSPMQRRLDQAMRRITTRLPTSATSSSRSAETLSLKQQVRTQSVGANVTPMPKALDERFEATINVAERPAGVEPTPLLRPVTGLRRLAALATTAASISQQDVRAERRVTPLAGGAIPDLETFEAQLLLLLQRAARRHGIDADGIEP